LLHHSQVWALKIIIKVLTAEKSGVVKSTNQETLIFLLFSLHKQGFSHDLLQIKIGGVGKDVSHLLV